MSETVQVCPVSPHGGRSYGGKDSVLPYSVWTLRNRRGLSNAESVYGDDREIESGYQVESAQRVVSANCTEYRVWFGLFGMTPLKPSGWSERRATSCMYHPPSTYLYQVPR